MTEEGREFTWEDFGASPEMRHALVDSETFIHLFSTAMITDARSDPRPFLQLGAAIMLDKPIVLMVDRSDEPRIPEHLRRVADRIIFYDHPADPAAVAALAEAIKSLFPED